MKRGIIFDIEEFAVYDGPGIRQTVFLKGCPLRCNWCHNPEGLLPCRQLMVSRSGCISCGACKAVCKNETCVSCGECIDVCPLNLRRFAGTEMTSEELVGKLRKQSDYYSRYGGGVTFSGGEPMLQAPFLLEVLNAIPDMHRAIETSGYAEPEVFQSVMEKVDYIFMDLKIMDPVKHREYTGVDNARILKNTRYLCGQDKPFVIRIPLIPGVNDDVENYTRTAEFLRDAKTLERVELMPYNKAAGAKYTMVGKVFHPRFDPTAAVNIRTGIFEQYGIRSVIL